MATMTRRELLKASATTGLVLGAPAILSAQSKQPINIGTLCPLTGAGGSYGPDMQRSVVAVVERINKAGGILGRPVQLFHEDDQTSAEAGVRAARKLIDVNKVIAIVSTWASAVTLAVKPLCVEAQVFLIGVSGADAVTQGDHKGYVAHPAQHEAPGGHVREVRRLEEGVEARRVPGVCRRRTLARSATPSTPSCGGRRDHHRRPHLRGQEAVLPQRGHAHPGHQSRPDHARGLHARFGRHGEGHLQGRLQGRDPRAELRGEREIHRGHGRRTCPRASGTWTARPCSTLPGYKEFSAAVPRNDTSPYAPQAWDQMSIVALALAAGKGEASGTVIKDHLRAVANPPGTAVYSFAEGRGSSRRARRSTTRARRGRATSTRSATSSRRLSPCSRCARASPSS